MLNVGISGGIGSGKSTVCKIFKGLQIPIYNTDSKAKELTNNSKRIRTELMRNFGSDIYQNNILNTSLLRKILFNDQHARTRINEIIHPEVWNDQKKWLSQFADEKYVLTESALLFDTGSYTLFNFTINVTAPLDDRIKRLMIRDKTTKEEILQKINAQKQEQTRCELANFIIYNDEKKSLIEQVYTIHNFLIQQ